LSSLEHHRKWGVVLKKVFPYDAFLKLSNEKQQMHLVSTMLRVVTEQGENIARDLLELLRSVFGGCTLSVVDNVTREVLFSTMEGDISEIEKVARSVRELGVEEKYIKHRRNGVWFREGYRYIRTVPLRYREREQYTLLVEQEEDICKSESEVFGILSMAVYLEMADKRAQMERSVDFSTGLHNRDALLEEWKKGREFTYIGMFCLKNEKELVLRCGYSMVEKLMQCAADILWKAFPQNVYRVGTDKFAVFFQWDAYVCAARAQDCMGYLLDNAPEAEYCSVLMSKNADDSIYKIMYACEYACKDAVKDTVSVIRGVGDFDTGGYREDVYVAGAYEEKEDRELDMDAVYEKRDFTEQVVTESTVGEGDAEETLQHFYGIPEEEELLDRL